MSVLFELDWCDFAFLRTEVSLSDSALSKQLTTLLSPGSRPWTQHGHLRRVPGAGQRDVAHPAAAAVAVQRDPLARQVEDCTVRILLDQQVARRAAVARERAVRVRFRAWLGCRAGC
ncbi:hypothetical protein ACIA5C_00890 [Actinoplanes sp. NPDC051343]|uniref:hypothetical protein n=1 Tax=Actinoplanes sp. NPDC051343 TaxID=3363906 RepID=UPI0037B4F9D2